MESQLQGTAIHRVLALEMNFWLFTMELSLIMRFDKDFSCRTFSFFFEIMVFAECNLFYDENITLSKLKKEKKRKTIVVR